MACTSGGSWGAKAYRGLNTYYVTYQNKKTGQTNTSRVYAKSPTQAEKKVRARSKNNKISRTEFYGGF